MEPPVRTDSESIRDEKVKVLKAIPPLEAKNLVRGQFGGYRKEQGVAPDSQVETFAALQVEVNSWRWKGVPFYIRAGKCLPVTCTEVLGRFRKPPTVIRDSALTPNHFRFRISPEVSIAIGTTVIAPGEEMVGQSVEMLASRHPRADEMDAYERVLGDAMAGAPPCLPVKTTWKKHGASSIRSCRQAPRCMSTSQVPGGRVRSIRKFRHLEAGRTRP